MGHTPPEPGALAADAASVDLRRPISGITWRFLGERAAADQAYCVRFNVARAPEPLVAMDGAWAYALPAVQPPR